MFVEPARPPTVAAQAGRHAVHFYDRDDELADVVARHLADGLRAGEPAVVIATPAHRALFVERLRAHDVDVETARAAGSLTLLDAAETLARFMVGGAPDREAFRRVIGSVIEASSTRGTRSVKVRAYGEMVHLLWQADNRPAAVALEELWNDLATVCPFDLLCAYSIAGFPDEQAGGPLSVVCDTHTHVSVAAPNNQRRAAPDLVERTRAVAAENVHRRQVEQMLRGALNQLREAEAGQRDRAERANQIADDLREAVRVNELFMGVLAHDLRAPLAAIVTSAQLMKLREADGDRRNAKALGRLLTSGERMARMVEQLLDFTRLRVGGGVAVEPRPADMAALARQAVDELQDGHPGFRVQVTHEGDTGGAWDADRVSQVLSNLVANALQHGDPNAGVRVFIDGRSTEAVLVQVHNMGAIPAGLLPQVFDPLTGGGQRRRDRSRGLGLGLFISKQIAAAHGGDVQVTSSESDGTLFTVSLPRFARSATPAELAVPVAAAAGDRRAPPDFAGLAHEQLRESETRFRLLVDAVKDYAIFMLDPSGRVVTWNAGAERIKGYEAREIIGHHFSEFYEEHEVRAGKCEHALEVAARDGRFEDEGWRLRKDGTRFWANVVITALRAPNGELVGFAKVTRDLTERRRLEQEQLRLGKAEEAIRLRDEFLSLAAHELKTPLTVLQLQLDTLGGRHDPSGLRAATKLERAARSSERLASLVESLLDVSRIATGRFVLKPERIQLADCIGHVVDALGPSADQARCELVVDAREPIAGVWDPLRIEQALTNLLVNALKYGAGRPIRISAGQRGEEALLEVRDHGPGIPETELGRLFQRFERAASMRNYGGLGLGLYLIQGIVEAHGGTVTAANLPDGGACFRIALPLRQAAAPIDAPVDANATDVN